MTSSNGNIFRVTGHLCGEFIVHRWIPLTKDSDTEFWCFRWSAPEQTFSKPSRRRWFETHRAHYDVTVIRLCLMPLPFRQLQTYSEGFVNKMMRFHLNCDKEKRDAIVVRVHGGALADFTNREREILCMQVSEYFSLMMTSSNGNIFRVTGHLCGHRSPVNSPHTKASDTGFWCFLLSAPE